eukprot:COSAG01_NODE_10109_length_2248_cov_64.565379_3_plen_66_part_01
MDRGARVATSRFGPPAAAASANAAVPRTYLYAARYPALIRWRWIDDFLLKSEFSLGFMRTYKTYLS